MTGMAYGEFTSGTSAYFGFPTMDLLGFWRGAMDHGRTMRIHIAESKLEMAAEAANVGAELIRQSIREQGHANIIVATGASQLEMLECLAEAQAIDWQKVIGFHLDEYIDLPFTHPASFRLYLWQRFVSRLPIPMRQFHFLSGERDPTAECQRVGEILRQHPIDVAFVGIGENAHLAFNDPPADFQTQQPYLVVELDQACRQQQTGEGWFPTLEEVPQQAISMSVRQILKSRNIVCTVPDQRKAAAVAAATQGPVTSQVPASVLQEHSAVDLFLDRAAASQLQDLE